MFTRVPSAGTYADERAKAAESLRQTMEMLGRSKNSVARNLFCLSWCRVDAAIRCPLSHLPPDILHGGWCVVCGGVWCARHCGVALRWQEADASKVTRIHSDPTLSQTGEAAASAAGARA